MNGLMTKDSRLERVRDVRRHKRPDLSFRFLKSYFKQQVEQPYRQFGMIVGLWTTMVPEYLLGHSRLEGLTRGTLRVGVDSSSHLYELDRLLRSGLEAKFIEATASVPVRRIKLRLSRRGAA